MNCDVDSSLRAVSVLDSLRGFSPGTAPGGGACELRNLPHPIAGAHRGAAASTLILPSPFPPQYIRGVARDAMGGFAVQDLWERRSTVGDAVAAAIRTELNSRLGVFVNYQLQSLDIPAAVRVPLAWHVVCGGL